MNAKNLIRTLVHASNGQVELGEKSQTVLKAEMEALGAPIGEKSLRELLNGKKAEANGWKLVEVEAGAFKFPKAADFASTVGATEEPAAPAVNIAQAQQDAKNASAKKQLTPEQLALAANVENAMPSADSKLPKVAGTDYAGKIDPTTGKQTFRGTDWTKVLPQQPVAVKEGSMMHRLFVRLCDPKGATKQELMTEFGWSAGGLSGILHWEPKAKGYFLNSEKKDGELRYHLQEIGTGRRYAPEEVLIKAAAAPKAPKEPKAPKVTAAAAANASQAPKVTKEQRAQVPNMGAANITKRTAKKPQA